MPSSGASLLQAVLDSPEEDGPRLVYADWLNERGDPRGEFILLQCELARSATPSGRRDEVKLRVDELYAGHVGEWTRELTWTRDFFFRRGFVEQVGASADAFVVHAAA